MLLTENKSAMVINSSAQVGDFIYKVEHRVKDRVLEKLQCDISLIENDEAEVEKHTYVGYAALTDGKIQTSLPDNVDFLSHINTFYDILKEVRGSIMTE